MAQIKSQSDVPKCQKKSKTDWIQEGASLSSFCSSVCDWCLQSSPQDRGEGKKLPSGNLT